MSSKLIKYLIVGGSLLLVFLFLVLPCITASNNEVGLRNQFKQKDSEKVAFYDKMWKILKGKAQVAKQNDSSFRANINLIMTAREDAEGLMMKWIQEANPNANYAEVSALYKDLSRSIEAERNGFFEQEKVLQDIKLQHDNLLDKFPGTVLFAILGRKHLEYKPITSDRTDNVMKTGKDNDVDVF